MEGIEHHRQLPSLLLTQRLLRLPWMWAVRKSVRMQREGAVLDPLAAHELAARVIDRLVRHHVRMIVRNRYRLRIEIERPRTERAHNEPVAFKCLMHRRRKVKSPDSRLEILDVDRPRIVVAVPSDHVEWMMIEHRLGDGVALLDQQP